MDTLLDVSTGSKRENWASDPVVDTEALRSLLPIAHKLRQSDLVKTRRFRFRLYDNCVVGSECVKWMLAAKIGRDTDGCVEILQGMVDLGFVRHVTNDHEFKNENLFYCFTETYENERSRQQSKAEPAELDSGSGTGQRVIGAASNTADGDGVGGSPTGAGRGIAGMLMPGLDLMEDFALNSNSFTSSSPSSSDHATSSISTPIHVGPSVAAACISACAGASSRPYAGVGASLGTNCVASGVATGVEAEAKWQCYVCTFVNLKTVKITNSYC